MVLELPTNTASVKPIDSSQTSTASVAPIDSSQTSRKKRDSSDLTIEPRNTPFKTRDGFAFYPIDIDPKTVKTLLADVISWSLPLAQKVLLPSGAAMEPRSLL